MSSDAPLEQQFFRIALALQGELRRLLFSYTRSDDDAEDLLQDVYLKLLHSQVSTPMDPQAIRAFCLTTARNVAIDWLRHRKIVNFEPFNIEVHGEHPDERPHTDQVVNARQELRQAVSMLKELSPKCEEIFRRRRIHGESIQAIAAQFKITKNTVKSHLLTAARILRGHQRSGMTSGNPVFSEIRRRRPDDV